MNRLARWRPASSTRPRCSCGPDLEFDGVAPVGGHRRPDPVGGQLQLLGQLRQRRPPVGQLLADQAVGVGLVAQQLVLPQGVVAVLHRQGCPPRHLAPAAGGVGGAKVAPQHPHRPAVGGDVVHHQHQHVLIRPQGQELGPQRRLARQVEGPAGDGGHRRGQPGLVDVDDLVPQRAGVWLQDLLAGLAVGLREHRPQALVASDHVSDGGLERRLVEAARQPQRQGDVIGRTAVGALQLIQEPQPALGEGQGQLDRPLPGSQCQPGPVGPGQVLGQLGHGRGLEHRPDRQLRIQQRPGAGHHLHGQQGVAPEVEEVVVDAHRGQAQQLGEHLAQDLLVGGPGPSAVGGGGDLGCGQGLAVELGVGGQGQRVEDHHEGGHHVVGQDLGHVLPHDGGHDLPARRRHHVGHQPLLGRPVLPHHHHRLADVGVAGEDGLHLTQLDAKAPQLDLVVDPADEHQLALGVPAHQVAGAVHAAAGGAEGTGHEALGAQSGPVQVAPGQSRPGDVELAHDAWGQIVEGRRRARRAGCWRSGGRWGLPCPRSCFEARSMLRQRLWIP